MTNIHTNPKKAKPSWLKAPCSACSNWTEDDSPLDANTKALWNNQKIADGIRCLYDPFLAKPDNKNKCPYKHLIGGTIAGLRCDMCGSEFEILEAIDPRLDEAIKNPFRVDICPSCQQKKDKDLTQHRVITVLSNNNIVKE